MKHEPIPNGRVPWAATGPQVKTVYAGLTAVLLAIAILLGYGLVTRTHLYNDFFAFNSFARFITQHPASSIYQTDLLRAFQRLPAHKLLAFFYHPGMMLLVWPLAHLPYVFGYVCWISLGLILYVAAVCGRDPYAALVAVVAPSTVWTVLCGQSSMLVAALLVGGLKTAPRAPVLGGILLGLATYKPQLGLLVPIALLASRQWRTVASAVLTACVVVLASSLCFGWSVWPSWYHHIPNIIHAAEAGSEIWKGGMVMVSSNVMMFGFSPNVAHAVQLCTFVASALFVWRCFSRGAGTLQIAALAAATFLATPFAFNYDLPLFTASIILFVKERQSSGGAFAFPEILIIVAALMLPYFMFTPWLHRFSALVILAVAWMIWCRIDIASHPIVRGLARIVAPVPMEPRRAAAAS